MEIERMNYEKDNMIQITTDMLGQRPLDGIGGFYYLQSCHAKSILQAEVISGTYDAWIPGYIEHNHSDRIKQHDHIFGFLRHEGYHHVQRLVEDAIVTHFSASGRRRNRRNLNRKI